MRELDYKVGAHDVTVDMPQPNILVSGDFILDHHIYEGQRHQFGDPAENGVRLLSQLGGAALVAQLLDELRPDSIKPLKQWVALAGGENDADCIAYAYWRPFPRNAPRDKQFWRVDEAMGFGANIGEPKSPRSAPATALPGVVVLSDGGMGFRDDKRHWPTAAMSAAKWIVLKTSDPVGTGPLWDYVTTKHRERLVLQIGAHDLRRLPARISQGLSWEKTIADVIREVMPAGALEQLSHCRHLVVTLDVEAALWIDFGRVKKATLSPRAVFVHESSVVEGEWGHRTEGSAFGFQSCVAASLAWQLTKAEPDFPAALEGGLAAMRDLQEKGHGPVTEPADGFPAKRLADAIMHPRFVYSRAAFAASLNTDDPSWSLLGESIGKHPAYQLARLVTLRGPIALSSLPHLRIGKLLTAERQEIESLRSLIQIMRRYQRPQEAGKRPLSLAVFGPPGAGKSFAVRELANHVVKDPAWLEFNLSQFNDARDLIGAFHQIRDHVLQGKLPIAFFDEFDSQSYRWLASLLAPMQDGRFQDGQITHTLGKCVFVFAGGTSWMFDTFGPPQPAGAKESRAWNEFRLAKGPDFKSRFDCFLNVVGPNQRRARSTNPKAANAIWVGGHAMVNDATDFSFPIRRALMIRSELNCDPIEKLDVDDGLLKALLAVPSFTHGARSLSKILQTFIAARPDALRRSLLLPSTQLAMHTDASAFARLCQPSALPKSADVLAKKTIEVMAPAIHETWRELGRKGGWLTTENDVDFSDLDDFKKQSNRAAAARMLDNLQVVGLRLEEVVASDAQEQRVRDQLEYVLETLAEAEHNGWMEWHLAQDWRWAAKRDDGKKLHPCLKPYLQLPKVEVDKDRNAIRHYPDFAREARMKIVPEGAR